MRQALESFGYVVVVHRIGRPQHFIDVLAGDTITQFDYVIIACHGADNGAIIMPELGDSVYYSDEPRGNFGPQEIGRYLALKDTCIIGYGCFLGQKDAAKAFAKNHNVYIAPKDEVDGSSGLVFIILLFCYLACSKHKMDIKAAYKKVSKLDSEIGLFMYYE